MCLHSGKGLIRWYRAGKGAAGSGNIRIIVCKVRIRKTCAFANFVQILKDLGARAISLVCLYLSMN